jgi:hypothetical protein
MMFEQLFGGLKTWIESSLKEAVSSLAEHLQIPEPGAPFEVIRRFSIADQPITKGCITVDQDSWRIEAYDEWTTRQSSSQSSFAQSFEAFSTSRSTSNEEAIRTVILFEVNEPDHQECVLACRAYLKTVDIQDGVKLVLGLNRPVTVMGITANSSSFQSAKVSGTADWQQYEVRYHFKQEQYPGKIQVSVAFQSAGTLWVREVELLQAPIKSA